jgi:hypothetical protein
MREGGTMIHLDIPDGTDEVALEAFLTSLDKSARAGVRQMIADGASEVDIAAYAMSFDQHLDQEDAAIYEQDEARQEDGG